MLRFGFFFCVFFANSLFAETIARISNEELVYDVVAIGGEQWVVSETGAYCVEQNKLNPVIQGLSVYAAAEIEGSAWLGSDAGVYKAACRRSPQRILVGEVGQAAITAIRARDKEVWLGTRASGLFRVFNSDTDLVLQPRSGSIQTISEVNGDIWVGTDANAFELTSSNSAVPIFASRVWVSGIVEAADHIWFVTRIGFERPGPCFQLHADNPIEHPALKRLEVISVAEVDGEAWFATTSGVFKLAGGSRERVSVPDLAEPVNTIEVLAEGVWLGTTRRAYRRADNDIFEAVSDPGEIVNIYGITEAGEQVWFWGEKGAYLLDEESDSLTRRPVFLFAAVLLLFSLMLIFMKNWLRWRHRKRKAGSASQTCFISYSHKDSDFADRLYGDLKAAGVDCWRDDEHLKPGDPIIHGIAKAIRDRDRVLLCCSEHSLTSTWVEDEIEMAIKKERESRSSILIPLNLDDYLFDQWDSGHSARLQGRLAADFRNWRRDPANYRQQLDRLILALQ